MFTAHQLLQLQYIKSLLVLQNFRYLHRLNFNVLRFA